jgi:hypothetical protein
MSGSPTLTVEQIRTAPGLAITRPQAYEVQADRCFTPTYEYPNAITIEERLPGEFGFYRGYRLTEAAEATPAKES